ncbi:UDP-N-acetylmuramoyl-L-alanyl-D-glutamate--2,6-diaminopimelate ligase [Candidatus Saccharibacteria bacterium]|nr:UDP-N-acetylmuramoyl-L-alanyl-D-glutamate--2,6-diaminopimelate ligase [Candidatus Saccharibacteria bacterium]
MKKTLTRIYNFATRPYHGMMAFRAANKYDYPASGMTVIGVTGTNGKTTTCFMIYNMLRNAGKSVAMMTTVATAINDEITPQRAHTTTPDTRILNKKIAEFRDADVKFLVLEVTSHALSQHRIFGVPIDIAVLTNVTHDHLDYHGTFSNYVNAKRRLFQLAANQSKRDGRGVGVINADDPVAKYFASDVPKPLTYGVEKGDLRARQVKLRSQGVEYFVKKGRQTLHIKTRLPGQFNVYNSLAAVGVGLTLDLTQKEIEEGIYGLTSVEGRMNQIAEGQNFDVIIDFAHTPDSFQKLLPDLKKMTKGRLIVLFGAAGKRDVSKRSVMGRLAGENTDVVIITEEDPRGPVRPISEQIAAGAKEAGKTLDKDLFLIDDREKAIEFALKMAKKGDTVVLLGKGHEKTMERAKSDDPWDETEITRKFLKKLKLSS